DRAKIIGPERGLSGQNLGRAEKIVQRIDIRGGNLPGFRIEVVTEQIAVEVSSKLAKEVVQILLRLCTWLHAEQFPQVRRISQAEPPQISFADHSAIEEVACKYEPAKQCVEYTGVEPFGRYRDQLFPSGLKIV